MRVYVEKCVWQGKRHMSRNVVVMWDFLFVFVTIICTCPDTASVKNLWREKQLRWSRLRQSGAALSKSISGRHRAVRATPTSASGLRTAAHGRFKSDGLILASFGFAAAYSALEGPATSSTAKLANSAWDSRQLCNVELWGLVV